MVNLYLSVLPGDRRHGHLRTLDLHWWLHESFLRQRVPWTCCGTHGAVLQGHGTVRPRVLVIVEKDHHCEIEFRNESVDAHDADGELRRHP